jgi:hypothetical protein
MVVGQVCSIWNHTAVLTGVLVSRKDIYTRELYFVSSASYVLQQSDDCRALYGEANASEIEVFIFFYDFYLAFEP